MKVGKAALQLGGRTAYVLVCVLTSFYCVLAFIPFTWQQMLKSNLLPQAGAFARWHPEIQAVASIILLIDLWPNLRRIVSRVEPARNTDRGMALLALWQIGVTVWCLVHPVLIQLVNDFRSYAAAVAALLPAIMFCGLRIREMLPERCAELAVGR